ncbi:hypothetical protein BDF20DRAFT_878253 [Mycotypha africana]|uniref:uncharacterized protein n=1 Tax=Mycotypha africana TaxID=64632 RepID=UPI0022FFD88D|nr:uncharacterized protein BDF20DRAFT_878253 [Mycotypha africana]KAI8975369.1 hypothetical protein BDF20DRAFT_878253 [Mycotypha africana]
MNPDQSNSSNVSGRKILTPKRRLNRSNSNSSAGSAGSLGSWTNISAADGSLAGFGSASGTNNTRSPATTSQFSFGGSPNPSSSMPAFTFGQSAPSKSPSAPTGFNFGSFSSPSVSKANDSSTSTTSTTSPFTFGQSTSTVGGNSLPNLTFSFGQPATSSSMASSMPAFTFGQTASSTSFGNKPESSNESTGSKPAFSINFGASTASSSSGKPAFSSEQPLLSSTASNTDSSSKPTVTSGSNVSAASNTSTTMPSFTFGAVPTSTASISSAAQAAGSKPAFTFGSMSSSSFSTATTASTNSQPIFTFGGSSSSLTTAPTAKPAFTFESTSTATDDKKDTTAGALIATTSEKKADTDAKGSDTKATDSVSKKETPAVAKPFASFTFGSLPSSSLTKDKPPMSNDSTETASTTAATEDKAKNETDKEEGSGQQKESSKPTASTFSFGTITDKSLDKSSMTSPFISPPTITSSASETESRKRPFAFNFGESSAQPNKKQESTPSLVLPAKSKKRGHDDDDDDHPRFKKQMGQRDSTTNKPSFSFGEPPTAIDSSSLSSKALLHGNSPLRTSTVSIEFEDDDSKKAPSKDANDNEQLVFGESDENEGSDKEEERKKDKSPISQGSSKFAASGTGAPNSAPVFSFTSTTTEPKNTSKESFSTAKKPLSSDTTTSATSSTERSSFTFPSITADKDKEPSDANKKADKSTKEDKAKSGSSKLSSSSSAGDEKGNTQGSVKLAFSKVDDTSKSNGTITPSLKSSTKQPEPLSLVPPTKSVFTNPSETTLKTTIQEPSDILHSTKTYELPMNAMTELGQIAEFIFSRAKKRDSIQSVLDGPLPNLLTEIAEETRNLSNDSDTLALKLNDVDDYLNEMKHRIKRKFSQMYRSAQILKGEQIYMPSDDIHFLEEAEELARTAQNLAKMVDEIHETLTSYQQTDSGNYTPEQIGSILNKQSQALLSLAGAVNEIHATVQQTNSFPKH